MLIKPIISEKTMQDSAKGRYAFATATSATKIEIKKIVEKLFGVNVVKIQTSIRPGKKYRSGKRWIFKLKSDWKKATVTVKDGQKIGLFDMPGTANSSPQTVPEAITTKDKKLSKQIDK